MRPTLCRQKIPRFANILVAEESATFVAGVPNGPTGRRKDQRIRGAVDPLLSADLLVLCVRWCPTRPMPKTSFKTLARPLWERVRNLPQGERLSGLGLSDRPLQGAQLPSAAVPPAAVVWRRVGREARGRSPLLDDVLEARSGGWPTATRSSARRTASCSTCDTPRRRPFPSVAAQTGRSIDFVYKALRRIHGALYRCIDEALGEETGLTTLPHFEELADLVWALVTIGSTIAVPRACSNCSTATRPTAGSTSS